MREEEGGRKEGGRRRRRRRRRKEGGGREEGGGEGGEGEGEGGEKRKEGGGGVQVMVLVSSAQCTISYHSLNSKDTVLFIICQTHTEDGFHVEGVPGHFFEELEECHGVRQVEDAALVHSQDAQRHAEQNLHAFEQEAVQDPQHRLQ